MSVASELESFEPSGLIKISEADGGKVFSMPTRANVFSQTRYNIDPTQTVRISGEFRLKAGGSGNTRLFFGFQEFDKNGQHITPIRCNVSPAPGSVLTEHAAAGSDYIMIKNPAGWKKFNKNDHVVFNAVLDFRDLPSTCKPIRILKVEDNGRVTLAEKLPQSYPAGCGVRLHRDRAAFNNSGAEGKVLTEQWQHFSGEVRGMQQRGTSDKKWRPGTHSVRLVIAAAAPVRSKDIVEFRNIKIEVPGEQLVSNGNADLRLTGFDRKKWHSENGAFCGQGVGNMLVSYHVYEPDFFEAEAELELARLEGTAAAIFAGNTTWGFDGGAERRFFVEGRDIKIQFLAAAKDVIELDKPFKVLLKGNKGTMTLTVNGKVIGSCKYSMSRPIYIGLRPHRNSMRVKSFVIRGVRNGEGNGTIPIVSEFVDAAAVKEITLPEFPAPAGKFTGHLIEKNGSIVTPVALEVSDSGVAKLDAAAVKKAYAGSNSKYNLRTFVLKITPSGYSEYRTSVIIGNGDAVIDFPVGRIAQCNGRSIATVDGEPRDMIESFWSYNGRASGEKAYAREPVARFAGVGIKGNLLIVAPYAYLSANSFDVDGLLKEIELAMTKILTENPDSLIDIQFFLFTSEEWNAAHPDELIKLDNGKTTLAHAFKKMLMPSYASPAWRRDMRNAVTVSVKAMRKSRFADRMASFRVLYANCGEWNHWGYHEQAFVDFSAPMQKAFGQWLKQKYNTVENLRKAWHRDDVNFESSNLVPTREQRLVGQGAFRLGDPASVVPSADYYEFFSEYTVDTILHFTGAVKEASDNRLLAGSYYGYYFGHYYANPYHFQDSGMYALRKLVTSDKIDFCGAPNPYYNRINIFWTNHIAGSFALHNKLFVREGDMRTEYSDIKPHPHYGVPEKAGETPEIMKRDFVGSMERGINFYIYDFIADWYRNPELLTLIGRLNNVERAMKKIKLPPRDAEVAIIYSEETIPFCTSASGDRVLRDFSGEELNRMGIPVDLYLLSDLPLIDFSRYKVIIFPNTFYISGENIANIQKYAAGGNRTLIWLSAPGMVGRNGEATPETALKLTGIPVDFLPEPRKGSDLKTAWKKTLKQRPYARHCQFTAPEPGRVLAWFDDNTPAAVERQFKGYKNITVLHPFPDTVFWRDLLGMNKVHVYTSGRTGLDNFYYAGSLMGYTSRKAGSKQITLKTPVEVFADILTGEILARNSRVVKFMVPDNELRTRLFFAGSEADYKLLRAAAEKEVKPVD
ncbi:MAG: hypothetical protein E7047_10155 [Lentisphaerae bacterium]|nr:hypothetical protein [Lentisphaerota bacterium]